MANRVVFPAFSGEAFQPHEMRQLVSALELRFQSLEDDTLNIFDTDVGDDGSGDFAPIDHTHTESDITDLGNYLTNINSESIFDLSDVSGTPSVDDVLVWNGSQFLPEAPASGGAIDLNDLNDVDVVGATDNQVLTFDFGSGLWGAETPASSIDTLFDLLDTNITGQTTYDMLFNIDGTEWRDTGGALKWNDITQSLQLTNAATINWLDLALTTPVEMLAMTNVAAVAGDAQWGEVQLLSKFEGADAATAYTEVSTNLAVATFVANAQLDTAQFNFGTASLLLDGTGDYVTYPDIAAYDLGTNDWTIEGFCRFNVLPPLETSAGPGFVMFDMRNSGAEILQYGIIQDGFGYRIRIDGSSFTEVGTISGGISTGVWYHWAITRTGGNIRAYWNGNYETGDFATAPADMGGADEAFIIGCRDATDAFHNGWIDDVRMTIGTARYTGTGTYTIPTADFPVNLPVAATEGIIVGDPAYTTEIDGSSAFVRANTTINIESSAESLLTIGEDTTLRGVAQSAALEMYGETGSTIYGFRQEIASNRLDLGGAGANPVTQLNYDIGTVTYNTGATVQWLDSTLTDNTTMKQFIDRFQVIVEPGDRFAIDTDVGLQVTGGGYIQLVGGGELDVRDGGSLFIRDTLDTDWVEMSHDGTDFDFTFTNTANVTFSGAANLDLIGGMDMRLRDNGQLWMYDSTDAKYIQQYHDDTSWRIQALTVENVDYYGIAGYIGLHQGTSLRIFDSGDTDWADFSHDGTDFNTDFTTTTDWNITGLTGFIRSDVGMYVGDSLNIISDIVTATPPTTEAVTAKNNYLSLTDNYVLAEQGFIGSNNFQFINRMHGGEVFLRAENASGTLHTLFHGNPDGNANLHYAGVAKAGASSVGFTVLDGAVLRIEDALSTNWADFSHDGTDFNTDFTTTTDWNITDADVRIAEQLTVRGGSLQDNTGDIALGVLLNDADKSGIFVTSSFAQGSGVSSSGSGIASVIDSTDGSGLNRGSFFGGNYADIDVGPQGGAGWIYYAESRGYAGANDKGGFYARMNSTNLASADTGDKYAFNAHNYIQDTGGATSVATNFFGYRSFGQFATATSAATNHWDFFADSWVGTANGTTTNRRGVYISFDATSVTNPYGIYQEAADVPNYFAGNVGIGALPTADALNVDGDLRTSGDLTVGGTTTTINSNTVSIADNIILLNSDETGAPTENAGFEIERGTSTNVSLRWNETLDDWEITYDGATWYGILTDNDVPSGGLIADGTSTNNTLQWNGSTWAENSNLQVPSSGNISMLNGLIIEDSTYALELQGGRGAAQYDPGYQIAFGFNSTSNYRHSITTRHNSAATTGNAIDFNLWEFGVDAAGAYGTNRVMEIENASINMLTDLNVTGDIIVSGLVDGKDVAAHVDDATIHFTEASIDHTAILNIGTNTHAQIDTHLALTNEHIDWTAAAAGTIHTDNYIENVPTALSIGTITATTYAITSDGGADDIVLPEANTTQAGLLGSDKWDEIVANTLKETNATHTGQVTGANALALDITAITSQPASGAIVAADTILTNDGGVLSETTFTQLDTYFNSSLSFGSGDGTVTSVVGGVGVSSSGGTDPSIALTVDELAEKTGAVVGTDRLVGTTATTNWAETISGIPLSIFNDDLGHVENATHTGQVTGATALALDVTAITAQPASGAIAAADTIITNDSGVLSEATFTQMITFFDANLDFAATAHTHLLAAGATDVTATAAEVNLLDLAGLTAGEALIADTATTASWQAITESDVSDLQDYLRADAADTKTAGILRFNDSIAATFGSSDDVAIDYNGTNFRIQGGTNQFAVLGGMDFRVYDSTGADFIGLSHNGVDATLNINAGNLEFSGSGGHYQFLAGGELRVYDGTNADYAAISHDGTNSTISTAGVGGGAIFLEPASASVVGVRSGRIFRQYDSDNNAWVDMQHDGTDFNITDGTGTTDINISGFVAIAAGTVDADFDAITGTTFNGVALTTGGVATNYLDETGAYSAPGGSGIADGTADGQFTIWDETTDQAWEPTSQVTWNITTQRLVFADDGFQIGRSASTSNYPAFMNTAGDDIMWFTDTDGGVIVIDENTVRLSATASTGSRELAFFSSGGSRAIIKNHHSDYLHFTQESSGVTHAQFQYPMGIPENIAPSATFSGSLFWTTFQGHPMIRNTQSLDYSLLSANAMIWRFNNPTTIADPGTYFFRANNATLSSITEFAFDDTNAGGTGSADTGSFWNQVQVGDMIIVQQLSHIDRWGRFQVDAVTDETGWWSVDVTLIDSTGAGYVNSEECQVTYYPHADLSAGTIGGSITNTQVAFGAATANEIAGSADLTWDGVALELGQSTGNKYMRWYDSVANFVSMRMSGTTNSLFVEGTSAEMVLDSVDLRLRDNVDVNFGESNDVSLRWDAVDMEITSLAANAVWNWRDGAQFKFWDSSDTDAVRLYNDGADIQVEVTDGSVGGFHVKDGMNLRAYDTTDAAFCQLDTSLTEGQISTNLSNPIALRPNSTTKLTVDLTAVTSEEPFFIAESSAGESNVATYGQFWWRDSAPNIAFLQNDAGTDQPIGYNSMPPTTISASQNMLLAEVGYMLHKSSGVAITLTCAQDSNTWDGATWAVHNDDTEDITIAAGASVTVYWLEGGSAPAAGSVTVEQGGIVTVYKYSNTEFWVWGAKGAAAGGGDMLLGTAQAITADKTFNDSVNLTFGTGDDCDMYFNGTDLYIDMSDGADFRLRGGGSNDLMILANDDGSVVLYNDGTSQFATQAMNLATNTSGANLKDHEGTVRDVGFNDQKEFSLSATTALTLDDEHAGGLILRTGTGTDSVTMAAGTSFPVGSMCTVLNHGTAGTLTISDGSEAMYVMDGSGTVSDNTGFALAIGGVITIWRQGLSAYYVWGAGIP